MYSISNHHKEAVQEKGAEQAGAAAVDDEIQVA